MSESAYAKLRVISIGHLTPNMKRIVLSGRDVNNFSEGYDIGYVKLLFSPLGCALTEVSDICMKGPNKSIMRTYTIRSFDPVRGEMTIDVVLHGKEGGSAPASNWARMAGEGSEILIAGPGSTKLASVDADWFLFVGDMSALPAIGFQCETLFNKRSDNAKKGYIIIEVASRADRQNIVVPENITIMWLVNPLPALNTPLLDAIKAIEWLEGNPFIWVAGEFTQIRLIRQWLKEERQVSHKSLYVSSYWKQGRTEDQHKIDKRQDSITEEAKSSMRTHPALA